MAVGVHVHIDPLLVQRWWRWRSASRAGHRRSFGLSDQEPRAIDVVIEGETLRVLVDDSSFNESPANIPGVDPVLRCTRDVLIAPGHVVVDIGAGRGRDAVLAAGWVGAQGWVVAFEPLSVHADALEVMAEINARANVHVVRKALGADLGTVALASYRKPRVMPRLRETDIEANVSHGAIAAELSTLDVACAELSLIPDVLLVSAHGYEIEVLRGAANTLRKHRPALRVELRASELRRYDASMNDIWELIDSEHYDVLALREHDLAPRPVTMDDDLGRAAHLFFVPKGV